MAFASERGGSGGATRLPLPSQPIIVAPRWAGHIGFGEIEDELARLVDAVLAEAEAGKTKPLAPDDL